MKCENCKIGDLHFKEEVYRSRLFKFPKEIAYDFVCDNCGKIKTVYN